MEDEQPWKHYIIGASSIIIVIASLIGCLGKLKKLRKVKKVRAIVFDTEAHVGKKRKRKKKDSKNDRIISLSSIRGKETKNPSRDENTPTRKMTVWRKSVAPPSCSDQVNDLTFVRDKIRKVDYGLYGKIFENSMAYKNFENPDDQPSLKDKKQQQHNEQNQHDNLNDEDCDFSYKQLQEKDQEEEPQESKQSQQQHQQQEGQQQLSQNLSSQSEYLHDTRSSMSVVDDTVEADFGLDVGTLYFTLAYDEQVETMTMNIQKAVKLEAMDLTGASDPYIKISLLPDAERMKTRIIKRDLNPEWNEMFTFEGFTRDLLNKRTLRLQVYDFERFKKDDMIGDVHIPLEKADLRAEPVQYIKKVRPDQSLITQKRFRGEILISMTYDHTLSRISVTIMKCRNLKTMDVSTGLCDPYVKVMMLDNGRRIEKRKTDIQMKKLNPVWNHTMEFELPIDKARNHMFVFRVMDFDKVLKNRAIGETCIGFRALGVAQKQWTDMLCQPKMPVTVWHTLGRPEKYEN